MIDPSLALQTALRSHLIAVPEITDHVPADHVRAGMTRPDKLPAIIIADGSTVMNGRAAGGQFVATVFIDLHIWAIEDGLDRARTIGAAVAKSLIDWPDGDGFEFCDFKHTRTVWPRDPDPNYGHGVLSIEAAIQWVI